MTAAGDLTLEERCRLLGGASTWRTHAIDRAGVPSLKLSDGPNGVRGDGLGARRTPGVVVPVGIALGATWDPDLIGAIGDLLGREAQRKGVHVLLAPTVNLHRTPIGGRVFECFSEDPGLTAGLAVAYVRGVQGQEVAATVKHFVANDTEVDRFTVDVQVDERTLRELYLRPFEAAVRDGGAWAVMSAYNLVAGEHCAANRRLLTEVLRDEWGFDGLVVSDWFGSHDTVPSARAGLTLPMPGPDTIYGPRLHDAVTAGEVDESTVDALVGDVLRLIERVGAQERSSERPEQSIDDPQDRALCRRAVAAGAVLVRNRGALPLTGVSRLAVVGPNAADTRIMGGGSAHLQPLPAVSMLAAITQRAAVDGTEVVHSPGVRIDRLPPVVDERALRTPDGEPGLLATYRDGHDFDGPVITTDVAASTMVRYFGSTPAGVDPAGFNVTLTGRYVPEHTGRHRFSAVVTGAGRVVVGGVAVVDDPARSLPRGSLFFGQACEEQVADLDCVAGEPVDLTIATTGVAGFAGIRLGVRVPDPPDLLAAAVDAAADADAVVVVVGTNDEWETEGEDRTTIALPGEQDDLVRRVAAANPRTVVVVNAGSPVAMPWIDEVDAVLVTYFGGYEMGRGVADVLFGDVDPGGRLPVTYPRALEDTPAWEHYAPVDGRQHYREGLGMGYRGFLGSGRPPLFPFGHGLSYGTAEWGEPSVSRAEITPHDLEAGAEIEVVVPVRSSGTRAPTVVVQGYLSATDPPVVRPPLELAAWHKTVVDPGHEVPCRLRFGREAFRRWDTDGGRWVIDPGHYELVVAASAGDVRYRLPVVVCPNP